MYTHVNTCIHILSTDALTIPPPKIPILPPSQLPERSVEIAIELAHLHHYGAAVILSQRAHEQLVVELANEKHSDMITRQASK